jgi:hypothetical protein
MGFRVLRSKVLGQKPLKREGHRLRFDDCQYCYCRAALLGKAHRFRPSARFNVYNDLNGPARFTQLSSDLAGAKESLETFDSVWSIVRVKKAYITLTGVK